MYYGTAELGDIECGDPAARLFDDPVGVSMPGRGTAAVDARTSSDAIASYLVRDSVDLVATF